MVPFRKNIYPPQHLPAVPGPVVGDDGGCGGRLGTCRDSPDGTRGVGRGGRKLHGSPRIHGGLDGRGGTAKEKTHRKTAKHDENSIVWSCLIWEHGWIWANLVYTISIGLHCALKLAKLMINTGSWGGICHRSKQYSCFFFLNLGMMIKVGLL